MFDQIAISACIYQFLCLILLVTTRNAAFGRLTRYGTLYASDSMLVTSTIPTVTVISRFIVPTVHCTLQSLMWLHAVLEMVNLTWISMAYRTWDSAILTSNSVIRWVQLWNDSTEHNLTQLKQQPDGELYEKDEEWCIQYLSV